MHFAVNTRLLIPDKMDGIGRFTYETLLRISRTNPNSQFTFLFDRKIDFSRFDFPENVSIKVLSPPARHPILWVIWFEFVLKNWINRNSVDLFISPEGWIPPNLKCKSLGVIHDLNFEHHPENIIYSHRTFLKHFFPRFARRANRIATVSEFSKADIIQNYQISADKIDVVYNGANAIFKPLPETEKQAIRNAYAQGSEYFIFIGTLHPRKNLEHLFKAFGLFKKSRNSAVKLLIAGNRKWWPDSLEKIYQETPSKEDILFLGRLEDEALSKVLGAALCLTYLPYFEGFGIPILEAFQAKVPVITSDVSSMPEVANRAALLCSPSDVEQIADTMKLVVEDEAKRNQLIQLGLERAKYFSWDQTANLLWQSVQKAIE
tara:strand:- start:33868 stop:34995 length:1128 start_codon:yes stop_codon:yes gene_type:complete